MEFTLMPKSPRTTLFLVIALMGALVFVLAGGGKSKRKHGSGPVAVATQAAQALAELAVPGPSASGTSGTSAVTGADTAFGESPFLDVEAAGGEIEPAGDPGGDSDPSAADLTEARDTLPRLLGTIVDGDRRLALIGNHYASPGQMVGGWRVIDIEPGEARLERSGRTLTLKVIP